MTQTGDKCHPDITYWALSPIFGFIIGHRNSTFSLFLNSSIRWHRSSQTFQVIAIDKWRHYVVFNGCPLSCSGVIPRVVTRASSEHPGHHYQDDLQLAPGVQPLLCPKLPRNWVFHTLDLLRLDWAEEDGLIHQEGIYNKTKTNWRNQWLSFSKIHTIGRLSSPRHKGDLTTVKGISLHTWNLSSLHPS